MNEDRNETKYVGRFLGCQVKERKDKTDKYGVITIAYHGVRSDNKEPWYSVQDLFVSVENMKEVCADIPFDSKVEVQFVTGLTPGSKQRISKLTIIE